MRRRRIPATAAALAMAAVVLLFCAQGALANQQVLQTPMPGGMLQKYVDPLPHFAGVRVDGTQPLTITMEEFQQHVLPSTFVYPAPFTGTYVWGYEIYDGFGGMLAPKWYPAFTIETQKGIPTSVLYVNNLRNPFLQKYLTVDQTLHWADPLGCMTDPNCDMMAPYAGPAPAVVHLHGGEVASESDGGPDSWFTPDLAQVGPAWAQGVTDMYHYPNDQEAATLWFHDHTLGMTRLNVYAGLAGFYFLRDGRDTGLPGNPIGLPAGQQEVEIVIQDRMFDTNGQWYFHDIGDNPEHPFWIPEFLGDVIVVNGKTWPYLEVEPRRYRLRLLNGSNARFYELFMVNPVTKMPGPGFWQIGTDGGLLDAPVLLNDPAAVKPPKLLIAPGERMDIVVDFAGYEGQWLIMRNTARAPFPKGETPDPQTTGQIMQFRVGLGPVADTTCNPATSGCVLRSSPIVKLDPAITGKAPDVTRLLTLNEVMGVAGPLEAILNNTKWDGGLSPNSGGITESPRVGSTEVWEIVNLTGDAHPIHLHLIQFQILNRQNYNINKYTKAYDGAFPAATFHGVAYPGGVYIPAYGPPMPYGSTPKPGGNPDITPYLQGPPRPPEINETGWKDTFIMYPGEVTRVVARWAPQAPPAIGPGAPLPGVNMFTFDPTTGPGYVWHCHIIDHEDNEMMRPYTVTW